MTERLITCTCETCGRTGDRVRHCCDHPQARTLCDTCYLRTGHTDHNIHRRSAP